MKNLLFYVLITIITVKAIGQDMPVMDWIGPVIESERAGRLYRANLGLDDNKVTGTPKKDPVNTKTKRNIETSHVAATAFTYQTTTALQNAVVKDYTARLAKTNQAYATSFSAQMNKYNFSQIYIGLVKSFGYKEYDAADAFAAYSILGWMISNNGAEPTAIQAIAVRNQLSQGLAAMPALNTAQGRAQFGEEIKLNFVTLHAGWQSARREGKLKEFSDAITTQFMSNGTNLRLLNLSDTGFKLK